MSVWKIKYVVYFHYLNVRGKISMERKEPSTSEVAHIGAELALFKGAICERAEILGAVLAPINFKVAPVFFKFTLHMVQFGPYNGVNSAPKLVPKTAPFQWGQIDPKRVPNWTHSFWPHFGGQINSFNFTVWICLRSLPTWRWVYQVFINCSRDRWKKSKASTTKVNYLM